MPWLTITTFLPLVGAALLLLWPRASDRGTRALALVFTVATFASSLGILAAFDSSFSGFQQVEQANWVRSLNLKYLLGVDGISLFLVLITTFLFPIAVLASFRETRSPRTLMASMLALESFVLGAFLSLDLLLFFLFFEATLFPGYLIIGGWGGERRQSAALKFFLYTMAGSAFLFLAILFVYFKAGTFDYRVLAATPGILSLGISRALFLGFLIAFAVKAPLVPLHAWQPDAYTESPTGGLLVLAGVLPKIATYGLLRFNLGLFPEASRYFSQLVSILALVGIVYGAIVAIAQTDLKRLVAYSSISHVGFIVLGIFSFRLEGVSGSVLYMVNHALSTGALFVLVGFLYERTRTRELDEMGGVASVTPRLATVFLVVALASMGLPGLNNFVSEFLVILGAFIHNRVFGAIAVAGVALSAIYILWAYQRAMHGPRRDSFAESRDLRRVEYTVLAPLVAAIVFLGVFPKPLLDRVKPGAVCVARTANTLPHRPGPGHRSTCPANASAFTAQGSRP